jgi:hypothetical protein
MLDSKAERALAAASELLRSMFGTRLVGVVLYGSGAGPDHVSGASDMNLVVVLDEIQFEDLRRLHAEVQRWRRDRIATPLLIDRRFLRDGADVFPMELHDIRAQHRLLIGEDPFAALEISDENLRYQCEHEARGKLLRLRQLYLEIGGSRRDLRALMLDSLKTFLVVMRNLRRTVGAAAPARYREVLSSFAAEFGCAFPAMARLLEVKLGAAAWDDTAAEELFADYLGELQQLIDVIDRLAAGSPDGPAARSPSRRP